MQRRAGSGELKLEDKKVKTAIKPEHNSHSIMAKQKYKTTNKRLIPHARWTEPRGSAAHELNSFPRNPPFGVEKSPSPSIWVAMVYVGFVCSGVFHLIIFVFHKEHAGSKGWACSTLELL